jgi:hypothetical protein
MAIKTRTQKTSPNIAGTKRRELQEAAALRNKTYISPWEQAKSLRTYRRQVAGKTFANWQKKQSTSSNYKGSGKHAVEFTPDNDRREVIDYDKALTEYPAEVRMKLGSSA